MAHREVGHFSYRQGPRGRPTPATGRKAHCPMPPHPWKDHRMNRRHRARVWALSDLTKAGIDPLRHRHLVNAIARLYETMFEKGEPTAQPEGGNQ